MKLYPFILLIFFNSLSFAAAPATHVFFAELYLNTCKPSYTQKEREAFIRGTLFPDIRYLAHIPRSKTHAYKLKLEDISNQKNPFIAGKLFHSFVDEQRQNIVKREKILAAVAPYVPERVGHQLLKLVEDELCYHAIDSKEALNALKTYDETEKKQGVPFATIKVWHRHLTTYLKQSPIALFNERKEKKKGYLFIPAPMIARYSIIMSELAKNQKIRAYFSVLTKEFDTLFNCSKKKEKVCVTIPLAQNGH